MELVILTIPILVFSYICTPWMHPMTCSLRSIIKSSLLTFSCRLLTIIQLGKLPGSVDSDSNLEWSSSQNMQDQLKSEQKTWNPLIFRLKHVGSIKISVFIPQKSIFCISTTTFCLPSQIWFLFKMITEMIGASALITSDDPRQLSSQTFSRLPSIFYIIEQFKYNIWNSTFF